MSKKLIISAGGKNERMKDFLLEYFDGVPKHLLLLSKRKTIIEEITRSAQRYFEKIIISSNIENKFIFQRIFKNSNKVAIEIDKFLTGPLGPICRELLKTKKRVYGCAGDFFCQFSWKEFDKFHNSHTKPISILIAPSFSMSDGASFTLEKDIIVSWKRVKRTKNFDLINIGAYIIDPYPQVIKIISTIEYYKEDIFFDLFVPYRLVCGYNPNKIGFNINTPETYKKLYIWLKKKQSKL